MNSHRLWMDIFNVEIGQLAISRIINLAEHQDIAQIFTNKSTQLMKVIAHLICMFSPFWNSVNVVVIPSLTLFCRKLHQNVPHKYKLTDNGECSVVLWNIHRISPLALLFRDAQWALDIAHVNCTKERRVLKRNVKCARKFLFLCFVIILLSSGM